MIRPGLPYSVASLALGLLTAIVIRVTATEATLVVSQLLGFMILLLAFGLVIGSSRGIAAASVPVLATVMMQSGFSDEPSWIRSLVVGCLWFVTLEMGWEALERRDGSQPTRAALLSRMQDVTTVVGIALVVGFVAAIATSLAPSRTVLLQAVVLGFVLAAFVMLLRRVSTA